MRPRRAAIYGGTFDPVHNGHLKVARGVQQLFELDEVILIPACVPPHKRGAGITSVFHRFAMLALATQHDERVTISTAELDHPDRPYAVETVARMQQVLGSECHLFFVMGADSWADILTWREWEKVLLMTNHIVVTRPGYEIGFDHVSDAVRSRIVDLRNSDDVPLKTSAIPSIFITDAVSQDVSATEIRDDIREDDKLDRVSDVPQEVAKYIEKYELYR